MVIDQCPLSKWAALGLLVGLSVGRQCETKRAAAKY